MKISFTICSNNYLAKAKVVADTFIMHHPEYKFYIFLVDLFITKIDYKKFTSCEVVEIKSVFPNIEEIALKYNIIELNTAVKPFIFKHLFDTYKPELAMYLDPDLTIFSRFKEVETLILNECNNAVLTPHFCSPIDDGKFPSEIDFIRYGLYNLGFIAVKNSDESVRFVEWWHERLMKYGYANPSEGMFTDQLWINYAPLFFTKFIILKHLGYNTANWNLYERSITGLSGKFTVNEKYDLRFFHFSHYDFSNPYIISKRQFRHNIEDRKDVKELIDIYQEMLIANKQSFYSDIPCYYYELYLENKKRIKKINKGSIKKRIQNRLRSVIKILKKKIR